MTTPPFEPDDYDDMIQVDPAELGCEWCLSGFAPAGTHHVLGLVYVACRHCTDTCPCCGGIGIFPADSTCQHCLTDALATLGYTATFCHTCVGILTVQRIEETTL
ncbi:hypothetical protein GCM10009557_13800 [Virgisporangium ochraceum]|uniref:Uncharacterized protein n=1 Tax=Virgisporangium ochraceum TaxID=65505 RepID=A0A8J3ZVQ9_9ACTN|nr:hypothetical protein [Virgisporangium ochraceum]GIJ71254.1 hypothetical protein Voc01_061710 [Virgisporangium ochraceum]